MIPATPEEQVRQAPADRCARKLSTPFTSVTRTANGTRLLIRFTPFFASLIPLQPTRIQLRFMRKCAANMRLIFSKD